jgi:capsular exopolysaccharide synthesis family protein
MSKSFLALQKKKNEEGSESRGLLFEQLRRWRRDAALYNLKPSQRALESYFRIKNTIMLSQNHGPIKSILLTGAESRDGTTTTTKNLSLAMCQEQEKKVLIMDGNLRRPFLHKVFDVPLHHGLSEMVLEGYTFETLIKRTSIPNLWIVTAGIHTDRPQQIFESEAHKRFMMHVRERFDAIISDSAPGNDFAETLCLAKQFDGVVLVVQAEKTKRREILSSKKELDKIHADMLGVVLNRKQEHIPLLFRKFL